VTLARIDLREYPNGLLLELEDRAGRVGLGEASPLSGYSRETLGACRSALLTLDKREIPELSGDARTLSAELGRASAVLPESCAAARHALETALSDLLAQRLGEPLWALVGRAAAPCPVPSLLSLAALVDGEDVGSLLDRAEERVAQGIRTLKLKLGRRDFPEEIRRARALREALGNAIELRFDVNRRWSSSEASARLAELASVRPELVEEGIAREHLHELSGCPVPLALDESLQEQSALEGLGLLVPRCRLVALVLKPMALGGVSRCLELARWARERGIDVIVSHLFDGPVALAAAAHLALAIGSPYRAAGLAPHAGLAAWPKLEIPVVQAVHVIADPTPGLGLDASRLAA
jgi:o-succinylbenzoate synthase